MVPYFSAKLCAETHYMCLVRFMCTATYNSIMAVVCNIVTHTKLIIRALSISKIHIMCVCVCIVSALVSFVAILKCVGCYISHTIAS